MAENYLGQFSVDIAQTPYANYTPSNWAMAFVESYGQIDGSHHKQWVLDQVARILLGTPVVLEIARWGVDLDHIDLEEYRFWTGDPSQNYADWVEEMLGSEEDGEFEYSYDEGIAP